MLSLRACVLKLGACPILENTRDEVPKLLDELSYHGNTSCNLENMVDKTFREPALIRIFYLEQTRRNESY